ncbi:unnamed protein product [Schistosoma margrebowiei]|uniref:MARVEL domain-containing protein n=1 Tax=Schistosoma margrebowiei TaxID=48269 RepID=A0AA85AIY7_9TREM|nr:unnamed protein product [Schistosoma margrebowiei]
MSLNTAYASTIPAVFKIVEIILNIILIILVAVSPNYVIPGPGGWLFFVAILTTLISLFFYCIHLTNAIYRFSGPMTLIVSLSLVFSASLRCISEASSYRMKILYIKPLTASIRIKGDFDAGY